MGMTGKMTPTPVPMSSVDAAMGHTRASSERKGFFCGGCGSSAGPCGDEADSMRPGPAALLRDKVTARGQPPTRLRPAKRAGRALQRIVEWRFTKN